VTGTTDNRGKDGTGSVIASEAGFAHAGSIVDNEGSNLVLHDRLGFVRKGVKDGKGYAAQK